MSYQPPNPGPWGQPPPYGAPPSPYGQPPYGPPPQPSNYLAPQAPNAYGLPPGYPVPPQYPLNQPPPNPHKSALTIMLVALTVIVVAIAAVFAGIRLLGGKNSTQAETTPTTSTALSTTTTPTSTTPPIPPPEFPVGSCLSYFIGPDYKLDRKPRLGNCADATGAFLITKAFPREAASPNPCAPPETVFTSKRYVYCAVDNWVVGQCYQLTSVDQGFIAAVPLKCGDPKTFILLLFRRDVSDKSLCSQFAGSMAVTPKTGGTACMKWVGPVQ